MKAIITYARGWNALAATRSLGKRGIEVVTGDEYRFAPASFSKYSTASFLYPNVDKDPEGFLDCLEQVIREHRPDDGEYVLMPIHKEAYLISRHRKRFEPLIQMALPAIEQIEQVHDKGSLALYCREKKIPIPKTVVPKTPEEFRQAAKSFAYPSFVKVRESAAAVGVRKADSAEEAVAAFDEFVSHFSLGPGSYPLLQQGVPGDDYCATFLFDHGKSRASMTYHNLRTYPVKSGTGVLRETVRAPEIERIGEAILGSLGWHGVAEVDFRWEGGDAPPWMIEVNPRFWGGLTQAVEAGWDYPYLLYRLAVDGTVKPVEPHDSEIRTETPVMAMLATLHEVVHDDSRMEAMKKAFDELKGGYVKGNRRTALKQFFGDFKGAVDLKGRWERMRGLFKDHKHTVKDVLSWEDPLPALGVFYPMAVFLKHGKISTELLTSEGPGKDEPKP